MARKDSVFLAEKEVLPPHKRACDYCGSPQIGSVNGRAHCREHAWSAMDGVRPMQQVKQESQMAGVQAKQVAGRD